MGWIKERARGESCWGTRGLKVARGERCGGTREGESCAPGARGDEMEIRGRVEDGEACEGWRGDAEMWWREDSDWYLSDVSDAREEDRLEESGAWVWRA